LAVIYGCVIYSQRRAEEEEGSGERKERKRERKQNRGRTEAEVNFSQVCDKVYMIRAGLVAVCAVI